MDGLRLRRLTGIGMFLLTLVGPGNALADGVGLPTNVCFDHCGPRHQWLWERFKRGEGLDDGALAGVYSGFCYVIGQELPPDREHHVGFLIDAGPAGHALHLRFSFFTAEQPYGDLDTGAAKAAFANPVMPLSLHDHYAYSDYTGEVFFSRYWLRRDRHGESILLLSYFGYRTTLLCDAMENRVATGPVR